MYDTDLRDYTRRLGDRSDSERIQRAIDATPNGILMIPKEDYMIADPLFIRNRCSLEMHPAARLIAVEEMDFVLTYDGNGDFHELTLFDDDGEVYDNLGLFIRGGDIDAKGLGSCLLLANAHHYTLSDITLHNGKEYGLCVGGDLGGRLYELVATNVYCKCNMPGLGGNTGIYTNECDGHYTDCFVIDYTVGIRLAAGANRLTRCHNWGGTVPPAGKSVREWSEFYGRNKKISNAGGYTEELERSILAFGVPEMLKDSVSFWIESGGNVLDGCFADTAVTGFLVRGQGNVIANSGFYNNRLMGLRGTAAVRNESKDLVISCCSFRNATGTDAAYEGREEDVTWIGTSR